MPARIGHDSRPFYRRKLYGIKAGQESWLSGPAGEQSLPEDALDRVICADARSMHHLPDRSVHLMVTSPPYNVGKALRASTDVLTPTGWVPIRDLRAGDLVIAVDGKPTKVLGVYHNGPRELWRFTFSDGSWIDADADHLWLCKTGYQRDRRSPMRDVWVVMSSRTIRERWGDHPFGSYAIEIPSTAPVELCDTGNRPVDPYTLGALLGDGTFIPGGYARIALGTGKENVIGAIPYRKTPYSDHTRKRYGTYGIPGLGPMVRSLGLDGVAASEKFVPPAYLWAPIEVRRQVLAGLMDTDGTVVGKAAEYNTASPQLAADVAFLARSLGATVRIRVRKVGPGRADCYRVYIQSSFCPFLHHEGKRAEWMRRAATRARTTNRILRSIQRVGVDEAVCIRVDHPSGSFVAKGFIVTHNSYDQDLSLEEYLSFLDQVMREVYRVLVPGGRACINVANLGRKPYVPLASFVTQRMLGIGFAMRGEIIWNKASSAGVSMAWGSFASASNPVLRDVHEYIVVFSKPPFGRSGKGKRSTIKRRDFMDWTKSVWTFPAESAKRVGHPAPFPVELPRRLIELYTFEGEVVLDPFMGSGTTAVAAVQAHRRFVGYEIVPEYVELAHRRIQQARKEVNTGAQEEQAVV